MSYHLGQSDPTEATVLERIESSQAELLRAFRDAEKQRKYAVIIGIAGALFAAFRLGIVALPTIRDWRTRSRATPASNY